MLGEGGSRPGRRVRGRTLEPVWSTSSEKGDGRALSGRMGRLSRASLLSNFRTTGALVKPRREECAISGPDRLDGAMKAGKALPRRAEFEESVVCLI